MGFRHFSGTGYLSRIVGHCTKFAGINSVSSRHLRKRKRHTVRTGRPTMRHSDAETRRSGLKVSCPNSHAVSTQCRLDTSSFRGNTSLLPSFGPTDFYGKVTVHLDSSRDRGGTMLAVNELLLNHRLLCQRVADKFTCSCFSMRMSQIVL